MSHNNHNLSSCGYAEQMVSYLYGETDAREKLAFETHLNNCSNCADELASFGFVRSSVLDWRAADFSNLETPAFEFPTAEREKSFSPVAVSIEPRSWFARFKDLFSFNPTLAAAALAILIVCGGAVWLAFNFSGKPDVARNEANENSARIAASPTIEANRKPEEARVKDNFKESLPTFNADAKAAQQTEQRERIADKSAVKVSNDSPKKAAENSPRSVKNTNENIKKTTPVKKERVPNLTDAEDDEDKSIRLADLFEEIDTK